MLAETEMRSFRTLESPGGWLARRQEDLGISQARMARLLDRDPAQLNRWLRGREPIPRESLVEIATLDGPDSIPYVNGLKNCEEMAGSLEKECGALARELRLDPDLLTEPILDRIEEHASRRRGRAALPDLVTQHLATAIFVARMARKTWVYGEPLVSEETVHRHLKYPANVLLAEFLELDQSLRASTAAGSLVLEFREKSLESLRRTAKIVRPKSPWHEFARQHSVHMLARNGQPSDQEYAASLLNAENTELRRMAFYGLLISRGDHEIIDRFLHELRRNEQLARITIAFDALHYGDMELPADGHLPEPSATLDNMIINTIRHLETDKHEGIRELAAFKLSEIIRRHGSKPFATTRIQELVHGLVPLLRASAGGEELRLADQLKEVIPSIEPRQDVFSHSISNDDLPKENKDEFRLGSN